MITQNYRLTIILLLAAVLLLIPFLAMQFTDQVKWTFFDFLVMGILLFGISLISELVLRKVKKTRNRILLILTILAVFFVLWAELAVGIFGTPFAGN